MIIIGITGAIGMGKSTFSHKMRRRHIPVHDADFHIHRLLGPYGKAVLPVLENFPECGCVQKGINRAQLGDIVFKDSDKRVILEKILHPLVLEEETSFIKKQARCRSSCIILDIPLLFEVRADLRCDYVIVLSAPSFLQRQRVLRRPGMSPDKFDSIRAIQQKDWQKKICADWVISSAQGHRFQWTAWQKIYKKIGSGSLPKSQNKKSWTPGRLNSAIKFRQMSRRDITRRYILK